MTKLHTPSQALIASLVGPEGTGDKVWSAAVEALAEWRFKADEKAKIGDMLVEFFESEIAVDDMIATALRLRPELWENSKETLLPFIPARRKMEFLKKNGLLAGNVAGKFQELHDKRNNIAHPHGRAKRPGARVSDDVRKKFVADCRMILKSVYQAHMKIYKQQIEKEAGENRKAVIELLKQQIEAGSPANKSLQRTPQSGAAEL